MQCLVAAGEIVAGFALLERMEARGFSLHSDENCYRLFFTLLEACRMIGDSSGVSRVQAKTCHLGFIALAPVAKVLVQGAFRRYNGGVSGARVVDARQPLSEL